jgi:hypothetical protein
VTWVVERAVHERACAAWWDASWREPTIRLTHRPTGITVEKRAEGPFTRKQVHEAKVRMEYATLSERRWLPRWRCLAGFGASEEAMERSPKIAGLLEPREVAAVGQQLNGSVGY